ncbi:MAG: hypothetical protein Q8P02_03620 [Candidatus Micrarchaeota archaeon]|nr:hypothetical protein [Candidatus Micrarchaeota archaeon]
MQPKENTLDVRRFASFANERHRQTEGAFARKIVRRGQHAANILRKWLHRGKRNVGGTIPNFAETLPHEALIQASHLAFLSHDDTYLKKTKNAEKWNGFSPLTREMKKASSGWTWTHTACRRPSGNF